MATRPAKPCGCTMPLDVMYDRGLQRTDPEEGSKMKYHFWGLSVAGAAIVAVLSVASMPAAQQATPDGPPTCIGCSADGKITPRTADGHPDLSGFWDDQDGGGNNLETRSEDGTVFFDFGGKRPAQIQRAPAAAPLAAASASDSGPTLNPSYKPEYMAKIKAIVDQTYGPSTALDPQYDCTPLGVPRAMFRGGMYGAFQILQTPGVIAILLEASQGMNYRMIYTDGRGHPQDLDSSYLGDSIGHWDGDTLVVDVTGLNDETWLGGGQAAPPLALIHSDKEHVVERYTREGNVLNYQATVDDPVMFTKPWVMIPRKIHHASAADRLLELTCAPHDKSHIIKPTVADHFVCDFCAPDKDKK
jgi:hypothetical protein